MRVALGVSGGIAAYKAAELVRLLQDKGLDVQVVMTRSAREFITPLTFAALSGHKVITEMFGEAQGSSNVESAIEHIAVAQSIDAFVVAPATANMLTLMAHGIADDFLTTLCLATKAPLIVAPAMNVNMLEHAATQQNLETLRGRGVRVVNPDEGYLACGMTGAGRLASPACIAQAVFETLGIREDLEGEVILVTAGPTQEPLDAVRYLSNRSSGKMGYAIAEEAASRGSRVILVSGPVNLPEPHNVEFVHVQTAAQMFDAVKKHLEESTIIIKAAAVADYHRANAPQHKVKKTAARMSLELDPTVDILADLGRNKGDRLLIGFAAETENLIGQARCKLESKNCDMVVANLVSQVGIGFDSNENEVVLVTRTSDPIQVSRAPKKAIAARILDETMKLRLALHAK